MIEWQRPQQQRVHHAENGGAGGYAEAGDEDSENGEARGAAQRAEGVAEVLQESVRHEISCTLYCRARIWLRFLRTGSECSLITNGQSALPGFRRARQIQAGAPIPVSPPVEIPPLVRTRALGRAPCRSACAASPRASFRIVSRVPAA